jgi:hypothetical protein
MRVANQPSRGHTPELGLGFDFDFSVVGDFFKQAAPLAANIYAQKANIDAQKKMATLQMQQQLAVQRMQAGGYPPGQYPAGTYSPPYGMPAQPMQPGYMGRGAGMGDLPQWVMPAAIAGGVGLLALVLMRR